MFRLTLQAGAILELDQGDITREKTDAIVNAANASLMGGGGVDGAIHRAGGPAILAECRKIRQSQYPAGLPTGKAVASTAGDLPMRYVIHTVGPIYGGTAADADRLASCYRESLRVADELGLRSIAFPSISTGAYCYPMNEAAQVALTAVTEALAGTRTVKQVRLVLYGRPAYDLHVQAAKKIAGHGDVIDEVDGM